MNEVVNKCYSCEFHRQDCTFTLSSRPGTDDMQSKKRKLEETLPEDAESAKRYGCVGNLIRIELIPAGNLLLLQLLNPTPRLVMM